MVELIKELTNAGASIASIIVLAYLLVFLVKQSKSNQKSLDANTEQTKQAAEASREQVKMLSAVKDTLDGLKSVIGGCQYNDRRRDYES
jgi:large-conductance mechanosensitive channel